ncbi:BRO family protein [Methylomonas rosea]|uniref:BRO family protein n=1 Tax=Methylomonas rosea TaxID=2952227 RepID=A0ABT1TQL1_9GAMM|nr:BRO family protein [Methylomonas sp. WSC-7]
MQTPGGQQEITVINESGLYSLILGSRKPEAKPLICLVSEIPIAVKSMGYRKTL